MDRRKFLKNLAISSAGAFGASAFPPLSKFKQSFYPHRQFNSGNSDQPNVIVILADDMGFSDINCFGSEISTPNIDRLADGGIKFHQFYNAARCSPTRASLLTGLYPHQTGVGHLATTHFKQEAYQGYLNEHCVTLGEAMKNAGYRTLMTGKWHVGTRKQAWPSNRGFDHFYGEHSYVDDYFKPTHHLFLNGKITEPDTDNWYSTDAYTDYALKFINEKKPGQGNPYFLYLAYNAPHFPLQAYQEDIEKYRGDFMVGWDVIRKQRYQKLIELGIVDSKWDLPPRDDGAAGWHDPIPRWIDVDKKTKHQWALKMATYAAQIDRMDQQIGRLLNHLEERGELDNTLILFLSDNGGCAEDWINRQNPEGVKPGEPNCKLAYGLPWAQVSNTPFRLYKRWVHEGGISTPLIAHWPKVMKQGGRTTEAPGHVIDILPTCLDAAGGTYPETYNGHDITPVEGKSIIPALRNESYDGHETLGFEHEGNRAYRNGNLKISSRGRFGEGRWELYDLEKDRTEMHDLSRTYPKKKKQLINDYQEFANRTGIIDWDKLLEMNGRG